MTISGWWDRIGEQTDLSLAAQRERFQERQKHPPAWVRFIGRHRWVGWLLGTVIIVAEFAFGALLTAVITLVGTTAVVIWAARNRPKSAE